MSQENQDHQTDDRAEQQSPDEYLKQQQQQQQEQMEELKQRMQPLQEGELNKEVGDVLYSLVMDVPHAMGDIAEQNWQNGRYIELLVAYVNGLARSLKYETFEEWHNRLSQEAKFGSGEPDESVHRSSGVVTP